MSACSFSILITLNLVLTHGIPPEFRGGVHILLPAPHTIGSVPSLSDHAIAYRLRSLPRVRWHRASSPQGSSSDWCCLCITTDQMLLCSSLFPHPLLVHRVCMFKLSGVYQNISTAVVLYCFLKKNQNTPRPSEHAPVMGEKMSKRLGGIKGCKYKTSSWHLNGFPDADNNGSTV